MWVLVCFTELFNWSDDFSQCLGILFINFSCNGGCISKSFNKDVDCHSVIVKSTSLSCCLEAMNIDSKFHCPSVVSPYSGKYKYGCLHCRVSL